jgi:hypothetical protein
MKKKIIGFFASIFIVAMFAVPVMAASPNKVPVTAYITTVVPDFTNLDIRETDGVMHIENLRLTGGIVIFPEGGAIPLAVGAYVDDPCEGLYNPKAGMSVYTFDEIWTLDDGIDGTFVGTIHVKITGNLLTFTFDTMEAYVILHGTGGYEGQVLNLKMDWDTSDPATYGYTGTWLKP